jgi:ADP-heptose:LPS heptosyltransferase
MPTRILVIRQRAFGDTLLSTPLFRGLKQAYPQARLTVLVEPAFAPMLQGLPYIDEVLLFDRKGMKEKGMVGELLAQISFLAGLWRRHFDLVLDPLGTPRTAWITLATGAPKRVGFDFRVRKLAYTQVVPLPKGRKYIADLTAELLRGLGHEPASLDLDFPLSDADKAWADQLLADLPAAPVLVSPAGGWALKRYPTALLNQALKLIAAKINAPLLLVWGPGEEALCQEAMQGVGTARLAPATRFGQLAALMQKSRLLITNDGANKHLAVAMRCPSLTLFGPTSDITWHPPQDPKHQALSLHLDCQPCEALECPLATHACLKDLPPARVAETALRMLEG